VVACARGARTRVAAAAQERRLTARIAPGRLADTGAINWLACRLLSRAAGVHDASLFSTLARHRRLFRGWLAFAGMLMPGGVLPRQDTELAILRVAHLRGCDYEWRHHVRLGRRAGLDEHALERVCLGPAAPGWSDRQRALLAAVDDLVATRALDERRWTELHSHIGDAEVIELCLLVGHYEMLATTIAAIGIAADR
jgi:AhpD family alkylhydroperoxidase